MAIKVKLRKKNISGNRSSLYLDFYPAIPNPKTGELTRREFLNMYLSNKATTPIDKLTNKETQTLAEQIRQKRDNELNKPEIYSEFEKQFNKQQEQAKQKGNTDFVEYFEKLANKRKGSNTDNWISALHYLKSYTNGTKKFNEIDVEFCNGFREYLETTPIPTIKSKKVLLAKNSVFSYFSKFKAALKQALKDGYLVEDIRAKIESAKPSETQRNTVTIEELNTLIKTECGMPILKQAALFSTLTGLRFSDIAKLVWGEVKKVGKDEYVIEFRQQKTESVETLPIPLQAFNLLGVRHEPETKVFEGLQYSAWTNLYLAKWLIDAGIRRKITFHCFRHTYATLQLLNGTDIFTVSKMLGHKNLKTTQVYAKIVDESKRRAANKITLEF